jgi:type I restriction enzyme M protein
MLELEENEFNLNLPRYVDTFDPEEEISLTSAIGELADASKKSDTAQTSLMKLLCSNGVQ